MINEELEKLIMQSRNNEYRDEYLISILKRELSVLKKDYDSLNEKCSVYERKASLNSEDRMILNNIYKAMKPIADRYNYLNSILKDEMAKSVYAIVNDEESLDKPGLDNMPSVETSGSGKSKKKNRVIAGVLAGVAALSTILGAYGLHKKNNKGNEVLTNQVSVSESDVTKYINQLNKEQRYAWKKINAFQNYFNNTAAPSVEIEEDNGARLYLTAEECIALYATINAEEYSPKALAGVFGADSTYFTSANMNDKFVTAMRVLNYYYLTAEKRSGVDMLFAQDSDAILYRNYEDLLLKYNKDRSKENAQALHDYIMNEIFLNPSLENPKESHPGVLAVIGLGSSPVLYAEGVLTETELEKIIEITESVVCDELFPRVKEATLIEEKTENQDILEELPRLMDKQNIKVSSRDINFSARYDKLLGIISGFPIYGGYAGSETIREEVSRDEAIKEFGEEEVKRAEEEAKNEVTKDNEDQLDYGSGLDDAINSGIYDDVYDYFYEHGKLPDSIDLPTNGNEKHDEGVKDATDIMIEHAQEDASVEQKIDQVLPQDDYYVDDASLPDDFAMILK